MPSPKPRPSQKPRSQSATRASSTKMDSRTLDMSAPPRKSSSSRPKTASRAALDPNDAGVKRRARKKVESRKKNALIWGTTLCLTAIICGMSAGVYHRYDAMKSKVAFKNDTLAALQKQLDEKRTRLSAMSSSVGRERALVERGFVRNGERLLLFPKKDSAHR